MSGNGTSHEDVIPPGSNKRQRTSGMYRRKRAVAACQQCRIRKTKCDNARPVCGFCQKNQGQCIYPDGGPNDYSAFDPASLAILDRINHVVNLLETGSLVGPGEVHQEPSPCSLPNPAPLNTTVTSISQQPICEDDDLPRLDDPDFAASTCSCESILRWPIFKDVVSDARPFIFESGSGIDSFTEFRGLESGRLGRGVQEDDFIPLSKKFLAYVHVKNPILDLADFRAHVKEASENGLRWDSQSCLVLIACALACLSSPFHRDVTTNGTPDSNKSLSVTSVDQATASSYYLAAKKRLGLLETSILQVQCLFLCGVFEMYSLKPLQAWTYFNQASVSFRNLVWMRTQRGIGDMVESQRLEQRLYWSCMKSELEIRSEIPLPSSGIARFDYPDLFPSPPSELASPVEQSQSFDGLPTDIEPEEERSWFYYLSEISYRRILSRAFVILRRDGEEGWIRHIEQTIKQCEDLDDQIKAWCSHIPPPINMDHWEMSSNELAFYVRNRLVSGREWIRRPMVYYLIHQPPDDPYVDRARPLADMGLNLCVDLLVQVDYHHRHHGSWFVARTATARSLILLAAARSGHFSMPPRWKEAVNVARNILHHWSSEAPDLQRAATVLDNIASDAGLSFPLDGF
ncbi:vegetative cell wall protein gp1 [Annulohypoxylon maeteangense]|uniref:vegetative cell wall protein gp1 n=1 Tax=Annulohypoxylon maeteangense TaxID=1927788 RepID=UPI0020073D74|nr:vegetative cell wall protein gp1 [Annulohypoxylon maeteangense]KAI0886968.1 vegetative cell wall protein gp1 [Annulohypoxylon maeteangense]